MSCPEMTLEGITPDRYTYLISAAAAQGLTISGPTGSTTFQGFDFSWAYDPLAQTLKLQCTNKPFYVPCSMIESKIRSFLP